jgi:cytochrome c5
MSESAAAGLDSTHIEHTSFIKTPQQLIVVLLLSFLVPIIGILLLVFLVLGSHGADPAALEPGAIAARLLPVGTVEVIDVNAPKVLKTGEEIVKNVCSACHTTGAANAPKIGDKGAWGPRLAQGLDGLTKSAIKGKGAMPPRGGVPDLTDFEVSRAIVFMTNQSGASFKEPAAPKEAAAAPTAAAAPAADAKKDAPAAKK